MKKLIQIISASVLGLALAMPAQADHEETPALQDAWLDGRLSAAVVMNQHLNPFQIETDVVNGKAIISGMVDTSVQRSLATELALGIEGIHEVDNKLVVSITDTKLERQTQALTNNVLDSSITTAITTKYLFNANLEATSIDVDTDNQVVTLNGYVDSDAEANLAEQIAANTFDVEAVENRLIVATQ
jgi:hyperosmotically inducible protein